MAPALRHIYALAAVVPNSHTTTGHKRDDAGTLRAKGRERAGTPLIFADQNVAAARDVVPSPRRYVIASCIRVEA